MDSGWCWNIPMEDCDHRGYVFSSAFASVEQAAEEMRRKNPGMKEPWTVRFRSGRHQEFWKGNTVAIGNAYGFVEPLQSTAIHMIIVEIQNLLRFFPQELGLRRFPALVNRRVGEVWDELRWFLAAHYKYNRRLDTPFWRACRADTDVGGIQDVVEIYQERAPIGATPQRFRELDDSTFGVFRHDLLFMGQQLPTTYVAPSLSRETWLGISRATERLVALALDHAPGVARLRARPELLYRYVRDIRRS
jgi:tryptophan halogenase